MEEDPYWSQKVIKKRNRKTVLHALANGPMPFTQLKEKLGLSKPVLSNHLKHLKERKYVVRGIENDKVVYKLTEQAFEIPSLRSLYFETSVYRRILTEFFNEKEVLIPSTLKEEFTRQNIRVKEKLLYWDLKREYLAQKSEIEIVQAIDKWLAPFILYIIVQQLKSENEWIQAISGLVERIQRVLEQKDVTKLEEALRDVYSDRTSTYNQLSVIENLDTILENTEKRKQVYDYFSDIFKQIEKDRERIRW